MTLGCGHRTTSAVCPWRHRALTVQLAKAIWACQQLHLHLAMTSHANCNCNCKCSVSKCLYYFQWCRSNGPLTRYVKLQVAHAPGTFPPVADFPVTAGKRSWHASRHVRDARAVMHVGIAYLRWRGKRSRHSRRMRTRNFAYLARGPWSLFFWIMWLHSPTQWVINYHQHNYHQQKMAAASSGKEQQSAISLFPGLPASWNLHN